MEQATKNILNNFNIFINFINKNKSFFVKLEWWDIAYIMLKVVAVRTIVVPCDIKVAILPPSMSSGSSSSSSSSSCVHFWTTHEIFYVIDIHIEY